MNTFKRLDIVTWTPEAIANAPSDMLDSALVLQGEKLTVVSGEGEKFTLRNKSGHMFPANPRCVELVK